MVKKDVIVPALFALLCIIIFGIFAKPKIEENLAKLYRDEKIIEIYDENNNLLQRYENCSDIEKTFDKITFIDKNDKAHTIYYLDNEKIIILNSNKTKK